MPAPLHFRAWHKTNKTMRPVKSLEFDDYGKLSRVWVLDEHGVPRLWDTADVVVIQSTGLTDKNGKEIFEGDIVRRTLKRRNDEGEDEEIVETLDVHHSIVPINSPTAFYIGHALGGMELTEVFVELYAVEVIGNIYENPDLLPSA